MADERAGRIRSAYAVCTAMVNKHKRRGNPATVEALLAEAKTLWAKLFST
jgi:predicted metal-dependent hydrolase